MNRQRADSYARFVDTVKSHYALHGRHDLPWRIPESDGCFDPYKILVSEVMLQQTQVPRVVPKYETFLRRFPSVYGLACAPLGDVLISWQGLGYNRRAKFLWHAAQAVVSQFVGQVPNSQHMLESLPGIGTNTAGAIRAYAFNEPVVFIETNIRTVYIHHFFKDQANIPDDAIRTLVVKTLDHQDPRTFYWSLMDYGTHLKQSIGNLARASAGYAKQSTFAGSPRQIRGRVLRLLAAGPQTEAGILDKIQDERVQAILADLRAEGLIKKIQNSYTLP